MLDLFAGELGWAKAFAERGWKCLCVDLKIPREIPDGCIFRQADVLLDEHITPQWIRAHFDFGVASSPCENFSIFGMRNFHPDPPYPELGIRLFNHTRWLFEKAGIPYVMENVARAQDFVGPAVHHAGSFYLWGKGVPPLLPRNTRKGMKLGGGLDFGSMPIEERRKYRTQDLMLMAASGSEERKAWTAKVDTIPPELAGCVADYATRICTDAVAGKQPQPLFCQKPSSTKEVFSTTEEDKRS